MRKKTVLLAILLSSFFAILGIVYFLFFGNEKEKTPSLLLSDTTPTPIAWSPLPLSPHLLDSPEYPPDLRNYLEDLYLRESIEFSGNRDRVLEKIEFSYPGEPGQMLFAIYSAYATFRETETSWQKEKKLSLWEREEARRSLLQERFPPSLRDRIFPWNATRAQESLLWFAEDYVAKNPYSLAKERWRAIRSVREELYEKKPPSENTKESSEYRWKILLLVHSREWERMSPIEKKSFREDREESLTSSDFWN